MCSQSKQWWNNALTTVFKEMRMARDMAKSYYQNFDCESEIMTAPQKSLKSSKNSQTRVLPKAHRRGRHTRHVEFPEMDMWEMCIYIASPIQRRWRITHGCTQ